MNSRVLYSTTSGCIFSLGALAESERFSKTEMKMKMKFYSQQASTDCT